MQTAGYSGTPLAKKPGIKSGFKIQLINQPDYYFTLFTDMPGNVIIVNDKHCLKNLIHYFAQHAHYLEKNILSLKQQIEQDGIIWVSWPKKSSKVVTDITEDTIRAKALKNGLVDIKVCAVDKIWSALKLVIPVKDRIKNK